MAIIWSKPYYAVLFIIVAIVVYLFWNLNQWRAQVTREFADTHLQNKLFSHRLSKHVSTKNIFLILSLIFSILALMGPLWGEEEQKLRREGIDIVFALDLSYSMDAEDVAPTRLEKAKKLMAKYIQTLGGDRVGLVAFAGGAYPISPLTSDYTSLENYIETLDSKMLWNQGTNITEAINESVELLGESLDTGKVIILISDGEDHEAGVDKAVKRALEKKIEIFTLGVGETRPVPIPIDTGYGETEYKIDRDGETVLTSFRGDELRRIAEESGGAYIKIENVKNAVSSLKSAVNMLEKKTNSETIILNKKEQFQWFLAGAILCFFIYNLTPNKRLNT